MNFLAALTILAILAGVPEVSCAAFYRYYDDAGGVNVTNDYSSIPERYRRSVTVIKEKELEKRAKSGERRERTENSNSVKSQQLLQNNGPIAETVPAAPADKKAPGAAADKKGGSWLSRQLPLLKVLGIIALLIAAFVAAGKVVAAVAPRSLSIIIRVVMFAGLALYIFKGFADKVVDAFARIKEESSVAQKAVDKRSDKIQQQAE